MVASQTSDIHRVWRLVQELSSQLKQNQLEVERLRRCVELNPLTSLALRANLNGEANGHIEDEEYQELLSQLSIATDENTQLRNDNEALSLLLAEYEVGMNKAMEQVRSHAEKITLDTIAIHANYEAQLKEEREKNMQLQDDTVTLQSQVHRISELVRSALAEHSDVTNEHVVEALKLENEALHRALDLRIQ